MEAINSKRSASPATVGEAELLRSVSSKVNSPGNDDDDDDGPQDSKKKKKKATNPKKKKKTAKTKADDGSEDEGDEGETKKPAKAPQQYVDHTYTDYAIVDEVDLRLLDENSPQLPAPNTEEEASAREKLKGMSCTYGPMKKNSGGVVQPFPGKLLEVLERSDLDDIIDWMPHGRAFIVKKPKLFATNVLPRFFKQTKFLSFTRQLNLWGFKRITRGIDAGSYYHLLFLRGRPYLAMRMRRQKIKGTGMKLTPNPDGEPNFYKDWPVLPPLNECRVLPPLPPLPEDKAGAHQAGAAIDRVSQNMLNALQQQGGVGVGGGQDIMSMQNNSKKQVAGAGAATSTMDRVSENMLNALKYGAAAATRGGPADNMSSFLRPNDISNFSNQMMPPYGSSSSSHDYANPNLPPGHGAQRYPGVNNPPGGSGYDDLLLAPGVNPLDNASRLRYLEQSANNGRNAGGAGGLNQNDPIHDELSAMIASRSQQQQQANAATANMGNNSGMYPPQQLSSDRLLMERLRDLDHAQQVKREQQQDSMSMLHHQRAHLFDGLSSGGGAGGPGSASAGVHAPTHNNNNNNAAGQNNMSNSLSQGQYDRFSYMQPQLPTPGLKSQGSMEMTAAMGGNNNANAPPPRQDPFASARYGNNNNNNNDNPVESHVKDALREANHLEELALAQRAKARSLALAGALQSRFGGGVGEQGGGGVPSASLENSMEHKQQPQQQQQMMAETMYKVPSPAVAGAGMGYPPNSGSENIAAVDSRPSFGRPFGRKG